MERNETDLVYNFYNMRVFRYSVDILNVYKTKLWAVPPAER